MKAKVMTHLENGQRSSPFELYRRSDQVCETYSFSGNFSNLNKILKTQTGKLIIGQKPTHARSFQMSPCIGVYSSSTINFKKWNVFQKFTVLCITEVEVIANVRKRFL